MDRQDGVPFVVVAAEHVPELHVVDAGADSFELFVDISRKRRVLRLLRQLDIGLGISQAPCEGIPAVHPFLLPADLLHHLLGADVVFPEMGGLALFLESGYFLFTGGDVKDNLEVPSPVR